MKRKNSINKYNGKDTLHLILLVNTKGSRVLHLSMRYASQVFHTMSLLNLMSLSGISVMLLAE